jgi:S-adenosylmethionine:tRNA ribosyltransferase-isomerase
MSPATWPRSAPLDERLLQIDPRSGELRDRRVRDLPRLLAPGDLLIVNDAATLPASLPTRDGLELRLVARLTSDEHWRAIVFGPGNWRIPTERRPEPPHQPAGSVLWFDERLSATVTHVDPEQPRLIELRFDREGAELFAALYRVGRPIQYAYLSGPLELWHVQNAFAARPWAVEPASAGRPLSFGLLRELVQYGVTIATVTHAAGLSSTGSASLDARLPVPERYEIPAVTCDAITDSKRRGGRVIAAGTTVVRALEARALEQPADDGPLVLQPGAGEAKLLLGPGFRPRIVDGLLTGMHPPGTSHFALLQAFAPRSVLERALSHAEHAGYLEHEFGDSCLLLPSAAPSTSTSTATPSAER